jgi:CRP/FNR family cyclic AMP-dependent transcriptional regulator
VAEINLFKNARDSIPVAAGDVLFREGDDGDVMFALVEGEVELVRDGVVLEDVGPGSIFGEMALIDPSPRSATAQARTAARVVTVDRAHFTFLVQEHPTFALQVMTVMAERLRRANEHMPKSDAV